MCGPGDTGNLGIAKSSAGEEIPMEKPRLVIFDIDGTLLPGTSCERLFFKYLVKKKFLGFGNFLKFAMRGLTLATKGMAYIISANKGYLSGFEMEFIEKIGAAFFNSEVEKRIPRKAIIAVTEHKMRGHKVILLSGMPEFLLKNFSELLKVPEFYGSVMEIKNGKYTGKTIGVFPIVKGKPEIVEMILKKHNVEWNQVTAYADHFHDRFLLQKVGEPVAVNPDEKLKALAETNNWRIEYFT